MKIITLSILAATLCLFPAYVAADFTVNNILIEVGVSAGEVTDGFAGDEFVDISLSVDDGDPATSDFQLAEAVFELALVEDSPLSDFELRYGSDVLAMTNGQGTASALGNAIIVFELAQDFNVNSLIGDSVLFDSLGLPIELQAGNDQLLLAGRYSLSFGASASIQSTDTNFLEQNTVAGVIAFSAVPEPSLSMLPILTLGLVARRRERRLR